LQKSNKFHIKMEDECRLRAGNGSMEAMAGSFNDALEPFQPLFTVKVCNPIKDGEAVLYTIHTTEIKLDDSSPSLEGQVVRRYEDFEWLHHSLITKKDTTALIIPPLPARPVVDAKGAENKSTKQLGSQSKVLMGDDFSKDCRALTKYLRLMVSHRVFGKDGSLRSFLMQLDPAARTKIKKGILEKLSSKYDSALKTTYRDVDDHFQKERDNAVNYSSQLGAMTTNYSRMVDSSRRIACTYGHLATTCNLGGKLPPDTDAAQANKLLVRLGESLEDAKHGVEVDVVNDENSLGFQLDLAFRYSQSLKDMHSRRTGLLITYEESDKALVKAKPHKRVEAEETKKAAEKAFEECSEVARKELLSFHRARLIMMSDALCVHAEAKIKTARDTYALLARSLSTIKQM